MKKISINSLLIYFPDIIFTLMKSRFQNPHTFDMSNYYSGNICILGGLDLNRDEKETKPEFSPKSDEKPVIKLDWSFLKKNLSSKK
jgi:hypothetical protein